METPTEYKVVAPTDRTASNLVVEEVGTGFGVVIKGVEQPAPEKK